MQHEIVRIRNATLILLPSGQFQGTYMEARLSIGSWYETKENWGISHLLEHLLHYGKNALTQSKEAFDNYLEINGINHNAWTSTKYTGYWMYGPGAKTKEMCNLLVNNIFYPFYEDNDLVREKSVITQEYNDKYSKPDTRFNKFITQTQFGNDSAFNQNPLGTPQTISPISIQNLRSWHQKYYCNQNTTFVIAGKFNKDDVIKNFEELLSGINPGEKNDDPKINISLNTVPTNHVLFDTVTQPEIKLYWNIPTIDKMNYALERGINTIRQILVKRKFYKIIRDELGLVYWLNLFTENWNDQINFFGFEFSSQQKNIDTIIKTAEEIFSDFFSKPVAPKIFDQAVEYNNLRELLEFDSIDTLARNYLSDFLRYNRVFTPKEVRKIRKNIKQEVVFSHLAPHLNFKKATRFQQLPHQS